MLRIDDVTLLNIDVENLKNVLIKRFKFSETTTFFSQVES